MLVEKNLCYNEGKKEKNMTTKNKKMTQSTEEGSATGLVIFAMVMAVLLVVTGVVVYCWTRNKYEDRTNDEDSTGVVEDQAEMKAYKVGEQVRLKDGSSWNVLEDSNEDEDTVVLFGQEDMNDGTIAVNQITNYLEETYPEFLNKALRAEEGDGVVWARLLTIDELSKLSSIEVAELVPGTSLQNGITPEYVYMRDTVIDDGKVDLSAEGAMPVMIKTPAEASDEPARLVVGEQADTLPVRAVIEISKKLLM